MIDVVLPVLDEADALPWVLARMPDGYRAIVVDNGSTDGSAELALELGATVVVEHRRGFGAACWAGLCAADADLVAFMDCDGSLDPAELPILASLVATRGVDLALGGRRPEPGAWPWTLRIANRWLAHRVRLATSAPLSDIGPMRVARRQGLLELGLVDRRSGWPLEMVLRAAEAGWRIDERPVTYRCRSGRSKVTGTVRGAAGAVLDMQRQLRAFT